MKKEIKELKKVLEIYMIAERREKEASDFYRDAAEQVSSEVEKEILLRLVHFEMQHLKMMQDRYNQTLKKIQTLKKKQ
jgi:rubrerythrin